MSQADAPDNDFDICSYVRRDALKYAMPHSTEAQKIMALLIGCEPEYFNHLMPKVEGGLITTTDQFIEQGNEFKRRYRQICKCHTTPPSQFKPPQTSRNLRNGLQYLMNDNFYAKAQRQAIEAPPNTERAIVPYQQQPRNQPGNFSNRGSGQNYGPRGQSNPQAGQAGGYRPYQPPSQNMQSQPRVPNIPPEQMPALRSDNPPLKEIQKTTGNYMSFNTRITWINVRQLLKPALPASPKHSH